MTTIRRALVILILLAIAFFVYRKISPTGADNLLSYIKNIPVRLGLLSGDLIPLVPVASGPLSSGSFLSGTSVSTGEVLVFSSTLTSGGLFALEALVIPQQNTTILAYTGDTLFVDTQSTGGSLTIIQTTGEILRPNVVSKPATVTKPTSPRPVVSSRSSSSRVSSQDIALLNNLFE